MLICDNPPDAKCREAPSGDMAPDCLSSLAARVTCVELSANLAPQHAARYLVAVSLPIPLSWAVTWRACTTVGA